MKTLIQIQEELIDTVNSARDRWSHRKDGGHSGRMIRAANRRARMALERIGLNAEQVGHAIRDALDIANLERMADA